MMKFIPFRRELPPQSGIPLEGMENVQLAAVSYPAFRNALHLAEVLTPEPVRFFSDYIQADEVHVIINAQVRDVGRVAGAEQISDATSITAQLTPVAAGLEKLALCAVGVLHGLDFWQASLFPKADYVQKGVRLRQINRTAQNLRNAKHLITTDPAAVHCEAVETLTQVEIIGDELFGLQALRTLNWLGPNNLSAKRYKVQPFVKTAARDLNAIDALAISLLEKHAARSEIFGEAIARAQLIGRKGVAFTEKDRAVIRTTKELLQAHTEWVESCKARRDRMQDLREELAASSIGRVAIDDTHTTVSRDEPLLKANEVPDATMVDALAPVLEEAANLHKGHEALIADWRFTSKQLKKIGIRDLARDLLIGSSQLPGQAETDVYRYLCVLAKLHAYVNDQGEAGARQAVEQALQLEESFRAQLQNLREEACTHQGPVDAVRMVPDLRDLLQTDMSWLQHNWPTLRGVFGAYASTRPMVSALDAMLGTKTDSEEVAVALPGGASDAVHGIGQSALAQLIEPSLIETAKQLDVIAFPPEKSTFDVVKNEITTNMLTSELSRVEWWRMQLLLQIKKEAPGSTLYRTKSGAFGIKYPWYVVHIPTRQDGAGVAILEHPVEGSATYIIRDEYPGYWQELVEAFSRQSVRELNGRDVRHPIQGTPNQFGQHKRALRDHLQDVMTIRY